MLSSTILAQLQSYDQKKGLRRKIGGDAEPIQELREFYKKMQVTEAEEKKLLVEP